MVTITCTENLMMFGCVVLEISKQADRQTIRHEDALSRVTIFCTHIVDKVIIPTFINQLLLVAFISGTNANKTLMTKSSIDRLACTGYKGKTAIRQLWGPIHKKS